MKLNLQLEYMAVFLLYHYRSSLLYFIICLPIPILLWLESSALLLLIPPNWMRLFPFNLLQFTFTFSFSFSSFISPILWSDIENGKRMLKETRWILKKFFYYWYGEESLEILCVGKLKGWQKAIFVVWNYFFGFDNFSENFKFDFFFDEILK